MENNEIRDRRIYEALGGIREEIIAEVTDNYEIFDQNTGAAMSSRAKRKFYAKIAAAAACLVLIAGLMSAAPAILQRLNAIIPGTSVGGTEQSEINSELLNDQTELEAVVSENTDDTFIYQPLPYWFNLAYNPLVIAEVTELTEETKTYDDSSQTEGSVNTILFRKIKCRVLYSRQFSIRDDYPLYADIKELYVVESSVEEMMESQAIIFEPISLFRNQREIYSTNFYMEDNGEYYSVFLPIVDGKLIAERIGNLNIFDRRDAFLSELQHINTRIEGWIYYDQPRSEIEQLLPDKPFVTGMTINDIIEFFDDVYKTEAARNPGHDSYGIIKNIIN